MSVVIPPTIDVPHIAFIGKAGAGKTTAASFLTDHWRYVRYSFAGPLKAVALQLWGVGADSDRDKLQRLGVACRDIDPDVWCNLLVKRVTELRSDLRAVVDDCRFPNEHQALAELGFVFVRVTALPSTRVDRLIGNGKLTDEAQLQHISETALDDVKADHTIRNDEDRETFEADLLKILDKEAARQ